jgi:hypothetical protein
MVACTSITRGVCATLAARPSDEVELLFFGEGLGVTKPDCPVCLGLGWVCENHPHLPWTDDGRGCQCGAGMPCECNRGDGIDEPDVSGVLDETPPVKH